MCIRDRPRTVISNQNGIEVAYEIHFVKTIEKKNGKSKDQYQLILHVRNNTGKFLISPSSGLANIRVTNPSSGIEGANISYSGLKNEVENMFEVKVGDSKSITNKFKVKKGITPTVTHSTNPSAFYEAPANYLDQIPSGTWTNVNTCLLYTSPSPRDRTRSRMPSSA